MFCRSVLHRYTAVLLGLSLLIAGHASAQQAEPRSETDDRLGNRVQAELESEDRMPRQNLSAAAADDGIVTLSGTVRSLAEKRQAARIAKEVRGVRSVVNQIIIDSPELEERTILACVRRALHEEPVVEKAKIAAAVDDGTVAITGSVSSLAEKQFAEDAVASVAGVTDIINQLTVELDPARQPEDLKQEIEALIAESLRLQDSLLDVAVEGTRVSVSGTVATAGKKDLLYRLVSGLGVSEVSVDQVRVDRSLQSKRLREEPVARVDDAAIQSAIDRAFDANPFLSSHADSIDVDVQNGLVTLSGSVDRLRGNREAEQTAKDTVGVRDVSNELKVQRSDDSPSDAQIVEQTQAAVRRSAHLNRHDIRVESREGRVVLEGAVDSNLERRKAGRIADNVRGVVEVVNRLTVAPPEPTKANRKSSTK